MGTPASRREELGAAASAFLKANSPRRGPPKSKAETAIRKLIANPARHQPPRVIYVIGPATGAVKIGVATDVEDRLKALQTGHAETLQVYGVARVAAVFARTVERQCHRALRKYHRRGEWFDVLPTEAVDTIRRIAANQMSSLDGAFTAAR